LNALLDTHTFLWFVEGSPQLSSAARHLIESSTTVNFLSVASIWEMAIKVSLGKLTLRLPFAQYVSHYLTTNGFTLLPISIEHTALVSTLPFHHRDPFDRLIVVQALVERMALISRDTALDAYGVTGVW
jgi:PIN domain nuclease of toxin-antitoxin system